MTLLILLTNLMARTNSHSYVQLRRTKVAVMRAMDFVLLDSQELVFRCRKEGRCG